MTLFIRDKSVWVNFVHSIAELRDLVSSYIPGSRIVVGDVGLFSNAMVQVLLKFIEDHPEVDCYSSVELSDRVLLSRFIEIKKEPPVVVSDYSDETFLESDQSYLSARQHLGLHDTELLYAVNLRKYYPLYDGRFGLSLLNAL
mgnify:CR=1 FL=1